MRKVPRRACLLLTWLLLAFASRQWAAAQVTVAVRARPAEAMLADAEGLRTVGKLSPDLRAAMLAKATFVGQTLEGRAVLQFPGDVPADEARAMLASVPGVDEVREVVREVLEIDKLIVNYTGQRAPAGDTIAKLSIVDRYDRGGFIVVASEDGFSSEDLRGLVESDQVQFVEPNHQYQLAQPVIPNDPHFDKLWGMHSIRAPLGWMKVKESPDVIVAVIDTGVDYNHEDLKENMWVNAHEETGEPDFDDDGNGYKDDVYGYDFYNKDGDPIDGHSHGTHCAGTIGAVGNNGIGVPGVAWDVRIMAVQIFSGTGESAGAAQIAKAIDYAVDNGANILSNSWGGGAANENIRRAITRAETKGALFVAAAGNDGGNNDQYPHYPSSYSNDSIVGVLWIDKDETLSAFSNYGKLSVDLGAPGGGIYSTIPAGGYAYKSGTSMATPHVSGAAALVWQIETGSPVQRMNKVKKRLLDNARPLPALADKCLTGATLDISFLVDRRPRFAWEARRFEAAIVADEPRPDNVAQLREQQARAAIDEQGQPTATLAGNVMRVHYLTFDFNESGKSWVTRSKTVTPPSGWTAASVSVSGWGLNFGHDYYEDYELAHVGAYASVGLMSNGDLKVNAHALIRDQSSAHRWRGKVNVQLMILGP